MRTPGVPLMIGIGMRAGTSKIKEIQAKKKLHFRAKLVMEELVKNTTSYKCYGNTGLQPTDRPAGHVTEVAEETFRQAFAEISNVDQTKSQTTSENTWRRNIPGESKSDDEKYQKGSTSQSTNGK
ncbi:hypothetical protein TIFTF001_053309 [Ficus carica]|uniref:Uncharacterized protein n=1 Tax=Ficus carica TaxID=3494 RepID=A0AA88JG82_FICCA|nr:hypothetical protein TIFTF001_053309 [Ficus carica]